MQLSGPLLCPSSKKMKILPIKNSYFILIIFRKKNFLAPKNLIKLFYALNKTPLGFTGCSSIHFFLSIHHPFLSTVRPHLVASNNTFSKLLLQKNRLSKLLPQNIHFQEIHFQNCSLKKYIFENYIFKIVL